MMAYRVHEHHPISHHIGIQQCKPEKAQHLLQTSTPSPPPKLSPITTEIPEHRPRRTGLAPAAFDTNPNRIHIQARPRRNGRRLARYVASFNRRVQDPSYTLHVKRLFVAPSGPLRVLPREGIFGISNENRKFALTISCRYLLTNKRYLMGCQAVRG